MTNNEADGPKGRSLFELMSILEGSGSLETHDEADRLGSGIGKSFASLDTVANRLDAVLSGKWELAPTFDSIKGLAKFDSSDNFYNSFKLPYPVKESDIDSLDAGLKSKLRTVLQVHLSNKRKKHVPKEITGKSISSFGRQLFLVAKFRYIMVLIHFCDRTLKEVMSNTKLEYIESKASALTQKGFYAATSELTTMKDTSEGDIGTFSDGKHLLTEASKALERMRVTLDKMLQSEGY